VWLAALGPSERLLRQFQRGRISWQTFSREYVRELSMPGPVDKRSTTVKNRGQTFLLRLIKYLAGVTDVTLMCHCLQDEHHCHRHLLQKLIHSAKI
jgi:uncharacterized protein YeaO (DUF488 family)